MSERQTLACENARVRLVVGHENRERSATGNTQREFYGHLGGYGGIVDGQLTSVAVLMFQRRKSQNKML